MYKKGDRVVCINDTPMVGKNCRLNKGQIYTVREVVDGRYLVLEEFFEIQKTHNYCESRFQKTDILPEDLFVIGE